MLSSKPTFSLSFFTLIKRIFSSYSFSAIRVVKATNLRLFIFLWAILIPACALCFIDSNTSHDLLCIEDLLFYEDLQELLELPAKKDILFVIGDWNAKVGSQETPEVTGKFGLGIWNEAGQRLIEFC